MNRLVPALLVALILVAAGHGFVVWNADRHARDAAARHSCIQRVEAQATLALLTPAGSLDAADRLDVRDTLGALLDAC